MNNTQTVAVVVAEYRVLYDRAPLAVEALVGYAKQLDQFTAEDVNNGFRSHMIGDRGQYWPNPGEIIRAIDSAKAQSAPIPSAAFDQIMAAHAVAKYQPTEKRRDAMRERLHPVVFDAMELHGGVDYFAYLDTKQYGYARNTIAGTVATLADGEQHERRQAVAIGNADAVGRLAR